ncbi:winged helix-turn-helix domain-containing protein [Haloglomus litoreum]|uniref:winged helix-turn-helix domain-containing protein n=1 Tax=Haloglomus litoreum TaxID=3034026 RepID=UPI0023E84A7D|nr:winged helix-turn-helix domain-containing protein [Haloglomus sp. DT116]
MTDSRFVERTDPDEVFALLSNDTRVRTLRALWEAEDRTATFSELREAVGMQDSGQFNYHLDELVGRFVARTEDGYELTRAGKLINGAIEAGAYTSEGSIDPLELEEPCPTCGGARTFRYEDETVRVECDACPVSYRFGVPPAAFAGHDREAIPDVASRHLRTKVDRTTSGFCPFCDGPVTPAVTPVPEIDPDADGGDEHEHAAEALSERPEDIPWVRYTCRQCGAEPTVGLSLAFVGHPAVVSFHYTRGVDLEERDVWDFAEADPDHQVVRSREPFRASVTYEADGDTLTLTVDEDMAVVDIEESV